MGPKLSDGIAEEVRMHPSKKPGLRAQMPPLPDLDTVRMRMRRMLAEALAAAFYEFHNWVFDTVCTARDDTVRGQALQVLAIQAGEQRDAGQQFDGIGHRVLQT